MGERAVYEWTYKSLKDDAVLGGDEGSMHIALLFATVRRSEARTVERSRSCLSYQRYEESGTE